jgi:hypothetical protein
MARKFHSCKRVKGGRCLCFTKRGKARFAKKSHCR